MGAVLQEAALEALKKRQERFNTTVPLLEAAKVEEQVRGHHVARAPPEGRARG